MGRSKFPGKLNTLSMKRVSVLQSQQLNVVTSANSPSSSLSPSSNSSLSPAGSTTSGTAVAAASSDDKGLINGDNNSRKVLANEVNFGNDFVIKSEKVSVDKSDDEQSAAKGIKCDANGLLNCDKVAIDKIKSGRQKNNGESSQQQQQSSSQESVTTTAKKSAKVLLSSSLSTTSNSSSSGDSTRSSPINSSCNTSREEEISEDLQNDKKEKVIEENECKEEELKSSGVSTRARSVPAAPPASITTMNSSGPVTKGEKNEATKKVKKKTVTFKNVLETSDDVVERKVYNPDLMQIPLVPIIKKERSLVRSESIVKPSRLTEILKQNYNNLNKVKTMSFGSQETDTKASEECDDVEEEEDGEERADGGDDTDEEVQSKGGSSGNVAMGDKRFILPKRSLHSRRVIKPNKKFLDDMDGCSAKAIKRVNSGNRNNNVKLAVKGAAEDDVQSSQTAAESEPKSKTKSISFQEGVSNSGSGAKNKAGDETKETATGTSSSSNTSVDTTGDGLKIPCSNLFGQPINTSGNELNLTPFGSNKVILRQPRLQFAIPHTSFTKTFGFGSAESIKAGGSISNMASCQENSSIINSALNSNSASSVNCGICSTRIAITYFTQSSRKFGVNSCEACRKFISKMIKRHAIVPTGSISSTPMQCQKTDGNCVIPQMVQKNSTSGSNTNGVNSSNSHAVKLLKATFKERCHACWLKKCIKTYQLSSNIRTRLIASLPVSMREIETSNLAAQSSAGAATIPSISSAVSPNSQQLSPFSIMRDNSDTSNSNIFSKGAATASSISPGGFGKSNGVLAWTAAENKEKEIKSENSSPFASPLPIAETEKVTKVNKNKKSPDHSSSALSPNNVKEVEPIVSPQEKIAAANLSPTAANDPLKRQKVDLKGPRVKHVCRSASIVLGQPLATFPENEDASPRPESPSNGQLLEPVENDIDKKPCITCTDENEEPQLAINQQKKITVSNDKKVETDSIVPELKTTISVKAIKGESQKLPRKVGRPPSSHNLTNLSSKVNNTTSLKRSHQQAKPPVPIQQTPMISIDFWENYDPVEITQTGFGLIVTESIPLRSVCFLCGSCGSPDSLMYCVCCCEPYHQYCIEDEYNVKASSALLDETFNMSIVPQDSTLSHLNWLCPRCTVCYTCNMASGSKVKCQKCQKNYHSTCLGTSKRLLGADRPLICTNCLKCKSCGTTTVTKFVGNLPMCTPCFKLRQKGNFCPLCQKCYEENDFDLKMMECGECKKWVHSKCEGLTDEQYNMLSVLPENIEFFCRKCFKRNSSLSDMWRDAVAAEFKAGLLSVVKLLSKSRSACALLRLSPRKKTSMCACQPILSSKSIQFKKADAFEENSTAAEDVPEETQCYCALNQKYSYGTKTQSLLDVKRKIISDEYVSLQEFNYEVLKIINAVACEDLLVTYKEILSEAFPWFQNETKACTDALEEDMYCSGEDNAMDRIESLVGMGVNEEQQVPNTLDLPEDINEYFYSAYEKPDSRMCQFCKKMGEDASTNEHEEGRLLYSGQNTWVHTNCALWSAEVFEEIDGSLQNIHSAVSRGRMIKCSECGNKGATVGCNLRNCGEHYHYPCAKKVNCAFMADKTVYCPRHLGESEKKKCPSERDFDVLRPVYVELDRRRKKPVEANKIQFMIGSLRVKSLGKLHPLFSDTVEAIIPVDFMCTRLYWSVKEPWKIVEYSVRTMVQMPGCNRNGNISMDDLNRHFTVDHSLGSHFTQFGLGQIAKWHSNLLNTNQDEEGIANQNEEHTNGLQTEEEPQNNADLLPPEIKEAIFEDLPHDILDGISMLDIFPKLMNYEDLIAIDTNKEIYNELYKDSKDNMSDDDGSSQLSMDGFTPASTLGHVEDALLSATRPLSSSLTRELKRSKSEVLSRGSTVGGSRSQQRSSSFTWNSKLDSNSAKRRKVSMLQELGLSESVLRSLGNRQESKISVGTSDRNKSFPIDELKTNRNSISWTATKKFLQMSSDLVTDSRDSSSNMADRFKISQLDGMDDISSDGSGSPGMDFDAISQRQVKQLVIYSNKGAESPVKCDRCHCAYRTNESYQRHLATCEPMSSTSESESETTSRTPDNETTTANSNVVTVTVSEMCTSSAMPVITPQQLMPTFNGQILNANNLSGLQTIPSNIIPLQNAGSVQSIPLNGLNQLNGMQNVLMAQNSTAQPFIQPLNTGTNFQQATTSLFPTIQNLNDLSSANFLPKAAQRILSPNSSQMPIQLATNTLNLQNFNQNTSTANFTTSQSNQIISLGSSAAAAAGGQNIISIPQVSNITTTTTTVKSSNNTINIQAPPKSHIILPQPQQGDYKQLKKVNRVSNSIVATNRAKVKLGPQQIQSPIKKIQKSPEGTRPIQMMSSNLPMIRPQLSGTTTTVSTQQNAQTAQISATPISSAPMATLGQNLIFQPQQTPQPILVQQLPNGILQYVSTPMDTTNNGMQYISMPSAQPNPILNSGGFQLQTDASGNLILANTGGLQVLSQPQTQIQPQVIGTIIQNPATTIQCGMMATEQMVMGGTPALEMVQDPTTGCMYLTSQPVYYGLETIVQNTVMQSQQFVSTAMQGVLSQNSICQATTTQVFQASKIEPIMEVPGGYVVLNNVSDLQQKANTNTATSILPVSSAGPVLNSVQNITFPQQTQQTIQNQLIQQQSAHHSTPSLRALSSPPPVQPPIVKPTVKTSPMVVSKIQPQVTSTSNIKLETIKSPQPQQLHQVQITPVNKPQTVILPKPDSSTWISQPHHSENISQVHSNASTNMISISNCNNNNLSNNSITSQSLMVQPVQQQQHHHQQQQRGLTATPIKPATIVVKSIKPKGITKPVTITKLQQQTKPVFLNDSGNVNQQRINNHVNQTIENSITIEQIGDQNYQINLVNNTKPLVSQQSGYGVKVNQQSYDNQQMDVDGTKVRHYQNQTSQPQPLMSNNNYGQYSNSQQATIVTTTTSTPQIQLPSAPYTSNIPTNIVNPIPQNNSNGHHSNTRPMNRVLPMQTIHARQSPPTPPEPKILLQEEEAIQPVSPQHEEITNRLPVEQTGNCRRVQFGLLENSNMEFRSLNTQKVDSSEMKKKINEILDCLDKDVEMESEKEKEENEQRELLKIQEETEKEAEIQKENQIPVDNADPIIEFKKPKLTNVLQISNQNSENQPIVSTGPKLLFEIQSQDGFTFRSTSINELWSKVFDGVQQSRKSHGLSGLPEGPLADMAGYQMLGLKTNAMRYLLEQMPGLEKYKNYSPKYHPNGPKDNLQPFSQANNTIPFCYSNDMFEEIKENTFGSARCEPYAGRSEYDMFSWLASRHRKQPIPVVVQSENELTIPRRGTAGSNLPMAMRYRTLKETAKESVGVFRSHIHGRGLFCIRDIEAGEMVIEYAGELIRATLTDKREKYYEGKGIGCYMFRIDDNFVVDATMRGNAARFINHSCEPNCYSKVVDILGHKHIIIFALRRIVPGEELTYDYKFPFEDVKIPCSCGSKRCRKYLN